MSGLDSSAVVMLLSKEETSKLDGFELEADLVVP